MVSWRKCYLTWVRLIFWLQFLMVDIVVNHEAWIGEVSNVDYGSLIPFNNASYYHSYCPITTNAIVVSNPQYPWDSKAANNSEIQCWEGGGPIQLADLRTEDPEVQSIFASWIAALVKDYSSKHLTWHSLIPQSLIEYPVDGLRLDSASNVDTAFFTSFTKAAGVFSTGEVLSGVISDVCPYQTTIGSVLNYPMWASIPITPSILISCLLFGSYFSLIRALSTSSGTFWDLANEMNQIRQSCSVSSFVTVRENKD